MTFIQNKMTCLSPRTILLQQTTRSNLKFQCKIHERTRGPEAGGLEYFHDSIMKHIVAHGLSRSEEQYFSFLCMFFTS